ncbi:STAS domain-containing protein [Hymenobacter agri]
MTTVFHELLPESYLLILAPGNDGPSEVALARQLRRAERSGKSEVWVDCSLLNELSDEAAQLLWDAHYQLQEQFARLVLVHVAEPVRQVLLAQHLGPMPRIVPTLLDAARPLPMMRRTETQTRQLAHAR